MSELNLAKLRYVMFHVPADRLALFVGPLNDALVEFVLDSRLRTAALLAQVAHESGEFRWMEELATGADYDTREDLGNTRLEAIAIAKVHNSTPGRWWKGHGPSQITGYDNHLACGAALGLNLLDEPHLLTEPRAGCRSSCWFFRNAKLKNGTSVDLTEYADASDIRTVSLAWNRGLLQSTHDPLSWDKRQLYYYRALDALKD